MGAIKEQTKSNIKNFFKVIDNYKIFCVITLVTVLFAILNNFGVIFYNDFVRSTYEDTEKISDALYEVQRGVVQCSEIIRIAGEGGFLDLDSTDEYIQDLQINYINHFNEEKSYYCINSFFYSIKLRDSVIDGAYDMRDGECAVLDIVSQERIGEICNESGWYVVKSGTGGNRSLVYVEPWKFEYNNEEVSGYIGAAIELAYIKNTMLSNEECSFCQKAIINRIDKTVIIADNIYGENRIESLGINEAEYEQVIERGVYVKGLDVYSSYAVNDEIGFVQKGKTLLIRGKSNFLIFIAYIFAVLVSFMFRISREYRQFNIFDIIDKIVAGMSIRHKADNTLKMKTYAASVLSLVGVFVVHIIYAFIAGKNITYIIAVFLFLTVWGVALYLYNFGKMDSKYKRFIMAAAFMFLLVMFALCEDLERTIYGFLISALMFTGMCVYTLKRRDFIKVFIFSMTATVCMILINIILSRTFIDEVTLLYTALTFIFIFMVFVMHLLLVKDNDTRAREKNAILEKLRDTQEIIIANEKMTTLGHIVASVTHEINTPMGAIKASADTFSTNLIPFLKNFSDKMRELDEDDRENVFDLIELSFEAVKRLLSTSEIRSAKRKIKAFLEEKEIENAFEISNKIARLEICSIDEIEKRIDIFKKENINEILNIVCDAFFLVTGINTTVIGTNKVSKIVYALKSYSNISSFSIDGNIEEFNIIECIDNIITLYSNQFTDKISIVKSYDTSITKIIGNSEGIGQVCLNIIQNALYAMKDSGGVLTITTKKVNDMIYLEFADTGCGIAPENLSKIFEPLYTTKPLGEGSGLGLGICRRIIEGHKGTINVTSILNEGTSFFITLPINQKLSVQRED